MIAAQLAVYLASVSPADFTWSDTTAAGNMSVGFTDDVDRIGIRQYGGEQAPGSQPYDKPRVQFEVRDADPEAAYALAKLIYDLLHGMRAVTLADGTVVVQCHGLHSLPVDIGRDASHRHRFTVSFALEVKTPDTVWRSELG